MTPFEFFFSFYGFVLGMSVAIIAIGVARAFKHRKTVKVGWLTPLLAVFVLLDIATFWDLAWVNFRHLPYSYGLLVAGLTIALIYFIAASLVFPDETDEATSLDDHFWANRRAILLLLIAANLAGAAAAFAANLDRTNGMALMASYGLTLSLYLVLVLPAAFTRRAWLIATTIGLHILIYVVLAVLSAASPARVVDEAGEVVVTGTPNTGTP